MRREKSWNGQRSWRRILGDQPSLLDRPPDVREHLLRTDSIVTGYGKKQVLDGVSIDVSPGEIVALIGHNGAGKSTLLKAIFGMIPIWDGRLFFDGTRLKFPEPRTCLRSGIAYVPQGNRVFGDLTVWENLDVGYILQRNHGGFQNRLEDVLTAFPALRSRLKQRAGTLSGGEKQMLALSNALILSPRLLLLDEPSLGLEPKLVRQAMDRIKQVSNDSGTAVLIVEQKVREALRIANRACVLRNGSISFFGPVGELADETRLRELYL